jgi:O-antigen ligase
MVKTPNNPRIETKGKIRVCLEFLLLVFCLGLVCLRVIHTEGPAVQTGNIPGNVGDNFYSLCVSACLVATFVIWLIWSICSRKFVYRFSGLEVGLVIFCIAVVVSGFAAADKRQAITNIVVYVSPLLCAVLLVQLLDTPAKIRFVLAVIAALGVLCVYQGLEQYFTTNQATIDQYKQNPQALLEQFGIEPNSIGQFLFEHRLNSKNVSTFFTTRNSAGSFFLLCFFVAFALFFEQNRNRQINLSSLLRSPGNLVPVSVILLGLLLTRSKGAIIGLLFALVTYALLTRYKDQLKKHRRLVLILFIFLILAGTFFIFGFGMKYDRMPSGSSMLVRWQYWQGAVKMFAAHPMTGVGPGNFAYFYQRYKTPAAMEDIADPHNFPLSLLVQYGPLGLAGFLLMLFIPFYLVTRPSSIVHRDNSSESRTNGSRFASYAIILWVCILLALRILVIPADYADRYDVILYMVVRFYIPPVIVFSLCLLLLAKNKSLESEIQHYSIIALVCAVIGLLLHNMTDFAIFEPGVYTVFWVIIACLIAARRSSYPSFIVHHPSKVVKLSIIAIVTLTSWAMFNYAIIPVFHTADKIQQANIAISEGSFEQAHNLLALAAEQDKLASTALSLDARLYIRQSELQPASKQKWLTEAQKLLQAASQRNKADYKNFERLAQVYNQLADDSGKQEKADLLNKAFAAQSQAIERYPGCERLHFSLAQLAEKLGRPTIAREHYSRAVEIEQQYRSQFRLIYPEVKEVISRLGQDEYQIATERIKTLSR